ncbi:unnamed protein product [Microthlaspi erraticum]|uniref:RING-type domain-containing protein n=1 Tax=Microthlaspi erraticum TaxID=1685480 RepID=A0A6D2HF61_9BRAS|nr:unnamed protein product [Microthlaspi erraticum]
MFERAQKDRNREEKNLKVLVRDRFNSCKAFPVDTCGGSNEDGKSKEVLECSSRSPVSETEDSLQTPSSNQTSSPIETNSNPFYIPGQSENPSRNEITTMGASSLVQIWEARSQQSSSWQSQSSENSNSSSFMDEAKNNNDEEVDSQSDMSYVSESCEKEREARCFLPLVRIRGKKAFDDFLMMSMHEREEDLKWLAGQCTVSKFSPRGLGRIQCILRFRSFERCIAIQERHLSKPTNRSSRGSSVVDKTKKGKEPMEESNLREAQEANQVAKKAVLSGDASKNCKRRLKEDERKVTEEGEWSGDTMEKAIVMGSVEMNKASLSIAEKVNLWDSKERSMWKDKNEEEAARRGVDVEAIEINKDSGKKEEVGSIEEGKSMETEECRIHPQEVTAVISLDERKQEETETLSILESPRFLNGWDENVFDGEEEYEDYNGESEFHDWARYISKPRSYWDDLRKQRELEVMNEEESKKDDIIHNLIKEKTVSTFLASDLREEIDKVLISHPQKRLEEESIHVEEEAILEENETEKVDPEAVTICDGFSQTSRKSTQSFKDHEVAASISLDSKEHENTSSETQMICDLREEMKELQREMLELRSLVKTCVDFKKSLKFKSVSGSVSDSLQRNCHVCFEMPVDSLLYRCGHMCTCLKCGNELQWSTKKCPICMAPIVDVVRAFLDS